MFDVNSVNKSNLICFSKKVYIFGTRDDTFIKLSRKIENRIKMIYVKFKVYNINRKSYVKI